MPQAFPPVAPGALGSSPVAGQAAAAGGIRGQQGGLAAGPQHPSYMPPTSPSGSMMSSGSMASTDGAAVGAAVAGSSSSGKGHGGGSPAAAAKPKNTLGRVCYYLKKKLHEKLEH